jgi:hypothetical protein
MAPTDGIIAAERAKGKKQKVVNYRVTFEYNMAHDQNARQDRLMNIILRDKKIL